MSNSKGLRANQGINLILVGNPGVGKSAMLNALIGRVQFKSGWSPGSGMTFQFDQYSHNGNNYFDTPGLEDSRKRQQAANAIEEALKQNGKYKVIFVIFLQGGRVQTADAMTIKMVLRACEKIGHNYGIIINQVDRDIAGQTRSHMQEILASLFCEPNIRATEFVDLNLEVAEIRNKDDRLYELPDYLIDFIERVPIIHIAAEDVNQIDTTDWEELVQELQDRIDDAFRDKDALRVQLESQGVVINELKEQNDHYKKKIDSIQHAEVVNQKHIVALQGSVASSSAENATIKKELLQQKQNQQNQDQALQRTLDQNQALQIKLDERAEEQKRSIQALQEKHDADIASQQAKVEALKQQAKFDRQRKEAQEEADNRIKSGDYVHIRFEDTSFLKNMYFVEQPTNQNTYSAVAGPGDRKATFQIHFDVCHDTANMHQRVTRAFRFRYCHTHAYLQHWTWMYGSTPGWVKYMASNDNNCKQYWEPALGTSAEGQQMPSYNTPQQWRCIYEPTLPSLDPSESNRPRQAECHYVHNWYAGDTKSNTSSKWILERAKNPFS